MIEHPVCASFETCELLQCRKILNGGKSYAFVITPNWTTLGTLLLRKQGLLQRPGRLLLPNTVRPKHFLRQKDLKMPPPSSYCQHSRFLVCSPLWREHTFPLPFRRAHTNNLPWQKQQLRSLLTPGPARTRHTTAPPTAGGDLRQHTEAWTALTWRRRASRRRPPRWQQLSDRPLLRAAARCCRPESSSHTSLSPARTRTPPWCRRPRPATVPPCTPGARATATPLPHPQPPPPSPRRRPCNLLP